MLCISSDKKLSLTPENSGLRKLTPKRHIQILAQNLIYIMSNCRLSKPRFLFLKNSHFWKKEDILRVTLVLYNDSFHF